MYIKDGKNVTESVVDTEQGKEVLVNIPIIVFLLFTKLLIVKVVSL